MTKYHNKKIINTYGKFDSTDEWARFLFLKNKEKEGEISDLKRQVEYQLLPAQYRSGIKHLKTKDKEVQRLVERPCSYVADFVYKRDGEIVVEDVKGCKEIITEASRIKKKLLLWMHDIELIYVYSPTQWNKNKEKFG